MRCNACIEIDSYDNHKCIPQTLQGNCPICHEAMFDSTEPLRGMECGHVMHLSCFNRYVASKSSSRRITMIPCPLCKKKFEHVRGWLWIMDKYYVSIWETYPLWRCLNMWEFDNEYWMNITYMYRRELLIWWSHYWLLHTCTLLLNVNISAQYYPVTHIPYIA